MKKSIFTILALLLGLTACSSNQASSAKVSSAASSAEVTEETVAPEVTAEPEAPEEEKELTESDLTQILTAASKWTYTDPDGNTGVMIFYEGGSCYFDAGQGLVFEDAAWEFTDTMGVKVTFDVNGTTYGAQYNVIEQDGTYVMQNVSYPDKIWTAE